MLNQVFNKTNPCSIFSKKRVDDLMASIPLTSSLTAGKIPGSPTFTRASATTVRDHEGRVHVCEANEARFEGARRVKNLVSLGVESGFSIGGAITVTDLGKEEYSLTGLGGQYVESWAGVALNGENLQPGQQYTARIDIKASASEDVGKTIQVKFMRGSTGTATGANVVTITLAEDYRSYDVGTFTCVDATNVSTRTYVFAGTATQCHIRNHQVEQGVSIPSEFVSVGIATGAEEVPSTSFADWADPTMPDNWETWGTHNAFNYVEEGAAGGLRVVSDGTSMGITLPDTLIDGKVYIVEYEYSDRTASLCNVVMGTTNYALPASVGVRTELKLTSDGTALTIKRNLAACDVTFSYFSVKEVDHGANVDGVKYFDTENGNTVGGDFVVNEGVGAKLATVKGYLSEPQRENVCHWSDDIAGDSPGQGGVDNTWSNNGSVTSSTDSAVLNSLGKPMAKLTGDGIGGAVGRQYRTFSRTPSSDLTITTEFRAGGLGELNTIRLGVFDPTSSQWECYAEYTFDASGVPTQSLAPTTTSGATNMSDRIVDLGGGLYRHELMYTTSTSTNAHNFYLMPDRSILGASAYFSNVNITASRFATSSIPTAGGSVTRTASQLEAPNSILPDKGSLVLDINMTSFPVAYAQRIFNCGSYAAGFYIETLPGGIFRFYRKNGAPPITYVQSTVTASAGADHKVAISWDEATIRISVDGETPVEAVNAGTVDRTDNVDIGTAGFASGVERPACTIGDLKIYNKVYTGSKLQELST